MIRETHLTNRERLINSKESDILDELLSKNELSYYCGLTDIETEEQIINIYEEIANSINLEAENGNMKAISYEEVYEALKNNRCYYILDKESRKLLASLILYSWDNLNQNSESDFDLYQKLGMYNEIYEIGSVVVKKKGCELAKKLILSVLLSSNNYTKDAQIVYVASYENKASQRLIEKTIDKQDLGKFYFINNDKSRLYPMDSFDEEHIEECDGIKFLYTLKSPMIYFESA